MDPPAAGAAKLRFGPYEADAVNRELRKHGLRVELRGQSFEVLMALLERPGEVVTREALRLRLWPEGVHVEFDNSLNSAINRLRAALRDSGRRPKYIQTLPRLGYRFIGRLERERPARVPTLAVLPFENLNRDPEQDYFADGMADALTTELGNISSMRVISRQSVLHLRGTHKTLPEIARRLKAEVIVEGSILQAGNRVRIAAQLVQVAPEQHLWAKAYDCGIGDILTTQGEVARSIAEAIQVALTSAEMGRISRPRPVNPEAHLAYLKGRHHAGRWTRENFEKALEYFHLALQKDPNHALAYAHMADCYALLGHWGHRPFHEAFQRAKEAALRALALDDGLSRAHWAYAWSTWVSDWDLKTCEAETLRAIQLNPSDERARILHATLLAVRERPVQAASEARLALELDPLSEYMNALAAWVYLFIREYDQAAEQAHKALELFPDSLQSRWIFGIASVCRSDCVRAIEALLKAVESSRDPLSVSYLGWAHAKAGNREAALDLLSELLVRSAREVVPPRCLAILYAALGERGCALDWLEKSYQAHDSGVFWFRALPFYDSLHSEARFEALLRRVWGGARTVVT